MRLEATTERNDLLKMMMKAAAKTQDDADNSTASSKAPTCRAVAPRRRLTTRKHVPAERQQMTELKPR